MDPAEVRAAALARNSAFCARNSAQIRAQHHAASPSPGRARRRPHRREIVAGDGYDGEGWVCRIGNAIVRPNDDGTCRLTMFACMNFHFPSFVWNAMSSGWMIRNVIKMETYYQKQTAQ
jgi:hypothetical protein